VKVTVLLLSVDEATMLERSLPAALAQEPAPEVVVIDNACSDATAEVAAAHGVRRIVLTPRRSYAAALNAAIAQTGSEAVLLLNADCFLRPGFLAAALPRLAEDRVGSVAPKLLRAERSGDQIDAAAMFVDRRRKNGLVGHGRPADSHATPSPAFGPDGAAALYRRETLAACRLGETEVLDEDMALWASDADLAWRAQLLGWRSVYEPAAVAEHVRTYSPSTRAQLAEGHRRLQFRNRYLMMIKNETAAGLGRDLGPIAVYELLALGHVLLRERHLLGGYRDAWRLRRAARDRRRQVQQGHRQAQARGFAGPGPPFGLRPPA
jgi:GT2 family glycosyltransferase